MAVSRQVIERSQAPTICCRMPHRRPWYAADPTGIYAVCGQARPVGRMHLPQFCAFAGDRQYHVLIQYALMN